MRSQPPYWNVKLYENMFRWALNILKAGKSDLGIKVRQAGDIWTIMEFHNRKYLWAISLEEGAFLPKSDKDFLCLKDLFEPHLINRALIGMGVDRYRSLRGELENRRFLFLADHHRVLKKFYFGESAEDIVKSQESYNHIALGILKEEGYDPEKAVIVYDTLTHRFIEVMTALTLVRKGYAVFFEGGVLELMIPIAGMPDGIAVKVSGEGFTFKELLTFGKNVWKKAGEKLFSESLAIEVKPEPREGSKGYQQLAEYISTGYFTKGLLACPGRVGDERHYPEYSYLTWDYDGNEHFYEIKVVKSDEANLKDLVTVSKTLINHVTEFGIG